MLETDARCKDCDYPLKGLPSGDCPECGRPFDWNRRSTYRLGDEVGEIHGMWINRKRALLRLLIVLSPGMLVWFGVWFAEVRFGYWGCFLIVAYPFWLLACTVCTIALVSPTGQLGTMGAMIVGVFAAFALTLIFGMTLSLWGLVFALPVGLVGGLVFKHMELNDML